MALLKGKYVQGSSLDGSKIKLKNGEALKGTNTDGSDKEILKVNGQNKTEFPEVPMVLQDPVADGDLARKAYVDAQRQAAIAHAESLHLGQATAISNEVAARQAGDSALSARVTTLETSTSNKDYVDQKVLAEKQLREAGDSALDARIDVLELDPVTKTYVDAGDQSAKAYADQKIADLVNSAPATLDTLKEIADAIAADGTLTQGLVTQISGVNAKVDAEAVARQAADQVLDGKITQEKSDRLSVEAGLQSAITAEVSRAQAAEGVLSGRVDPLELDLARRMNTVYENNPGVYADGRPGVQDPSSRPGWYFTNSIAGSKINWQMFYTSQANVTLGNFGAYAIVTFDSVNPAFLPFISVYTTPGASGNGGSWYRSRQTWVAASTPTAGTKYLMYFGSNPTVFPSLPRLQMKLTTATDGTGSSQNVGPQLATETVLAAAFGTNSAASPGSVRFVAEELAVNTPSFKYEMPLAINMASLASLNAEISRASGAEYTLNSSIVAEQTARASADAALQTSLNSEIAARQAADTAEASARQAADATEAAARQAADTAEATARQAGDATEKSAREAADAALSARLQPLETDPVTKTYVNGKMADEVSARQAADGALSGRLSVLEADPTTKSYVDSEVAGSKSYTDGKISGLINGAPAMLDTLKEIADAIGAGSDVATGLANRISQEISDRQAADLVLDGKISSERSRALVEEARIEGKVDAETSAREQAIIAEATARDAAISVAVMAEQSARELFDASFDQRLNQEVLDRQAAMVAEQVARDAAVAGLASAIGEELTFVASNLAQETSARQAADVALDARLDSIEAAPHIEGRKEVKTLGAGDLAYVDMAGLALDNTMMVIVGGLVHHEGDSYSLSAQGGVTRITWAGDLAAGGLNPLVAGDKVYCQYIVNATASQSGGGGGGSPVLLTPDIGGGLVASEDQTTANARISAASPGSLYPESSTVTVTRMYDMVDVVSGDSLVPFEDGSDFLVVIPKPESTFAEAVTLMKITVSNSGGSDSTYVDVNRKFEILVNGIPEVNITDMSDSRIAQLGKARVTWSFSGTAVAIEGRSWDAASGQYAESISHTDFSPSASGTLIRYASRTATVQKLLRRLVGENGGTSDWFETIIPAL